jgi:hypothetical protein
MAEKKVSVKHLQIDNAQSRMLAIVAIAVVISVFSLAGIKSMVVKGAYQRRVIHARKAVADQLKSNVQQANALVDQYKVFAGQNPNILGGNATLDGNQNGANQQIVLDALPSKYDAPALASSVEKVLQGESVTIRAIDVKDDPSSNPDAPVAAPTTATMTFSFQGTTNYSGGRQVIQDFERSIRPFDITSLQISGTDNELSLEVTANTYFQPAKSLDLTATKVVK